MNKLVAVLLSVYKKDRAEFVCRAIDSVLNQSYDNIVLIVGVDGLVESDLLVLLEEYEKRPNVKVLWRKENRGLAAILNDTLDEAKACGAEYYARMDADDIAKLNRFEKQISFLEENSEIDVVGGAIEEIDENGVRNGKIVKYPLTHDECFKFFAIRDPLAHPAVMFRKSFFEKATSYNAEYRKNQDTELWYRGFKNGCRFANLEDVVLSFRVSNDLYKRRGGTKFAKDILNLRMMVVRGLGYGLKGRFFAYAYYLMAISPGWLKRMAYSLFR